MNYKGLGEKAEKLKDLKFLKLERDVFPQKRKLKIPVKRAIWRNSAILE